VSRYKVLVDDNFHFTDVEHRYELGTFPRIGEAIAACKRVVDDDLEEWAKRRITAKELYELWACFGEDPFVIAINAEDKGRRFSAWDYAKRRSQALAVR
jgi:hypothetical protein